MIVLRMQLLTLAALAAMLAVAPTAQAQVFAGVGVGATPYGSYPYAYFPFGGAFGYFGYFPSAYSSSWTNGFSLYGPPVPTYGPIPGAFGGSDQRIGNFRYGYAALYADKFKLPPREGLVQRTYVQFELKVPDTNADVTVNNIPLHEKGLQRSFRATNVPPGIDNLFKFRVAWSVENKTYRIERDVVARTGTTVRVDLSGPQSLPAPKKVPTEQKP